MRRPQITNASIFIKLRLMLEDNVNSLKSIQNEETVSSDMKSLISSLIDVKNKILSHLPENNEEIGDVATTPTSQNVSGYSQASVENETKLLSTIVNVEQSQMDFVKNAVVDEGLPNELLDKLKNILDIYENVTDQLGRTAKTNQINSIVL